MRILTTRSAHEDSDKASLSLATSSESFKTEYRDLGDVNDGVYRIGLKVGPVRVDNPGEKVVFNYQIVNAGHHSASDVEKSLRLAGGALANLGVKAASTAAGGVLGATVGGIVLPVIGSILGAAAGWLIGGFFDLIFADCDGPVAVEQVAVTGLDLWRNTSVSQNGVWWRETFHDGLDSPDGCGDNSRYYTTWSVVRELLPDAGEEMANTPAM
ncbi:hypothetical protein [Kitasatospora cinereorecta]